MSIFAEKDSPIFPLTAVSIDTTPGFMLETEFMFAAEFCKDATVVAVAKEGNAIVGKILQSISLMQSLKAPE